MEARGTGGARDVRRVRDDALQHALGVPQVRLRRLHRLLPTAHAQELSVQRRQVHRLRVRRGQVADVLCEPPGPRTREADADADHSV